jgi:hypothetical protein
MHAVAYAPEDALGGNFLNTPPSSVTAFETSAVSLKQLGAALLPLTDRGGSIVGLDSTRPSPGRSTTGWASRRRRWSRRRGIWPATSVRTGSASTW